HESLTRACCWCGLHKTPTRNRVEYRWGSYRQSLVAREERPSPRCVNSCSLPSRVYEKSASSFFRADLVRAPTMVLTTSPLQEPFIIGIEVTPYEAAVC